jgi:hypothetical protein
MRGACNFHGDYGIVLCRICVCPGSYLSYTICPHKCLPPALCLLFSHVTQQSVCKTNFKRYQCAALITLYVKVSFEVSSVRLS